MRDYLFRAKSTELLVDSDQWVYGFGVQKIEYTDGTFSYAMHSENGVLEVDPETAGQYTGCLDFYDGDIARSPGGAIGMITWHDSWCGFYFKQVLGHNECGELVWMISSVPLYNDLPRYTKLGNRFDNPELLEAGA